MIFNDNEIMEAADRYVIDEWCSDHIVNYISLKDIDIFLKNKYLPHPYKNLTVFGYDKKVKQTNFIRVYPASFLDKYNNLIICGRDEFHNLLILDVESVPEFLKLGKLCCPTIDFKEKLKKQYTLKSQYDVECWGRYVPVTPYELILEEYGNI